MNDIVEFLRQQGVSDKGIKNLLGQFKAEGAGNTVENLNWSAKNLLQYFGKPGTYTIDGKEFVVKPHKNEIRFNTLKEAQDTAAAGAEAVGNKLYGGRMGNASDEGYKYRGRTELQITGKEAYEAIDKKLGLNGALVENPDLINDPAYQQKAIFSFLSDFKKMKPADFENMAKLHRSIGPATGGVGSPEYNKRVKYATETVLPDVKQTGSPDIPSTPESVAVDTPQTTGVDIAQPIGLPDLTNKEDIKRVQQAIGVKADGIWGPKSKEAWTNVNDTFVTDTYRQEGMQAPVNINQEPTGLENPFLAVKNWWNSL